MADTTRVLIVEDEPDFRDILVLRLGRDEAYEVDSANVDRWLEDLESSSPDVLLLDLTLRGEDVVPQIPRVVARCPQTMVAALTNRSAEEEELPTRNAGAFVFYEKSLVPRLDEYLQRDLELFRRALAGEDVVAPSAISRRLVF